MNNAQNASASTAAVSISFIITVIVIFPLSCDRARLVVVLNVGTIRRTHFYAGMDSHHNYTRFALILYGVLNQV